jgi:hypothetical protein
MKPIKRYIEYLKESNTSTPPMSDSWKANCIKFLKKGETVNTGTLSTMAKKEVILDYFPMADPNFKDFKVSDIGKYLAKNPKIKEQAKIKINQEIDKKTPKRLVKTRYSKKVDVLGFDAGYLNIDYSVTLTDAKILSFGKNTVTGTGNFKIWCSIPDGVLESATKTINVKANFTAGYKFDASGKDIVITISPKSIVLNSPKYTIIGKTGLQIINNKVKIIWGTYMKRNLGSSIVYSANPISELRKTMGKDVSFNIPKNDLRISTVPSTPAQVKNIVSKVKIS